MQESKLEEISSSTWREIEGSRLDQFIFLPPNSSAGGIILVWNGALFSNKLERVGIFSLTVEFCSKRDNMVWRCTSVYRPNDQNLKSDFWEELRASGGTINVPWVVCGDFNAIFTLDDKCSGAPNLEDISEC